MLRTILVAGALAFAFAGSASAQDRGSSDAPGSGGAGVRGGHITSTGETVPNPGASQSGGTTPLDRGVQHDDTKIQSSICKGC